MFDKAPWFEPPAWWKDGCIDGLTWDELLAREWTKAMNAPLTPRQLQVREWCRRMGEAFAKDRQETALGILVGEEGE